MFKYNYDFIFKFHHRDEWGKRVIEPNTFIPTSVYNKKCDLKIVRTNYSPYVGNNRRSKRTDVASDFLKTSDNFKDENSKMKNHDFLTEDGYQITTEFDSPIPGSGKPQPGVTAIK